MARPILLLILCVASCYSQKAQSTSLPISPGKSCSCPPCLTLKEGQYRRTTHPLAVCEGASCLYINTKSNSHMCLCDVPLDSSWTDLGQYKNCGRPAARVLDVVEPVPPCLPLRESGCCRTPPEYGNHLAAVMALKIPASKICDNINLMGRIDGHSPETALAPTLSQNNNFFVFAYGTDVLNKFLKLSEAVEDYDKMLQHIMNYVGFNNDVIDLKLRYFLTSFEIPSELPYNLQFNPPSNMDYLKPTWEMLSNYLRGKYPGNSDRANFQVCNGTYPQLSCFPNTRVEIDDETFEFLKTTSYFDLTGCSPGYPMLARNTKSPTPRCYFYNTMKAKLQEAQTAGGTPYCLDYFKENTEYFEPLRFTRAFFEVCLGLQPYFSGTGRDFNPETGETTGREFVVRGDIPLDQLLAHRQQIHGGEKPTPRCTGVYNCCDKETPCREGEGDCDSDDDCLGELLCGRDNCRTAKFASYPGHTFMASSDCCIKKPL